MGHAGTVPRLRIAAPAVAGYLLGSIPTAVIVGRRRHVDLRAVGDRNPGWWNAKEELGRRAALPVLVVDVAKGAAGAAIGRAVARPGRVVARLPRRGGGDDRPRLAAVRPLPRRAQRGHARRRRRRALTAPRRRCADRRRRGRRAGDRGRRRAASAPGSAPTRSPRWSSTDRSAPRPRAGSCRSSDCGSGWRPGRRDPSPPGGAVDRRWSGRARRRRRRRPSATASTARRGGCMRRAVPTSVPARMASRTTSRRSARRVTARAAAARPGRGPTTTSAVEPSTAAVDAGERERAAPATPRVRRRLVHPHRQQVGGVEVADGEAGGGHRAHQGDVLDGVVGDGAEATGGDQHARGARPCTGRSRCDGAPARARRHPAAPSGRRAS